MDHKLKKPTAGTTNSQGPRWIKDTVQMMMEDLHVVGCISLLDIIVCALIDHPCPPSSYSKLGLMLLTSFDSRDQGSSLLFRYLCLSTSPVVQLS